MRTWRELAHRLVPIIGERGFQALYMRSLHVTGRTFAILKRTPIESVRTDEFLTDLDRILANMEPDVARRAHELLLHTFTRLLTVLVGEALTARLLDSVPLASTADSQESPQ